jgi:alpha-beta hydrolase superfamily lysophospholipase
LSVAAVALLDATTYIAGHMEKITMPMLVLHGQADTVTSPEFSEILVKRASSEDKTVKIYDDMWHAIFSEEAWYAGAGPGVTPPP